MILKIENHFTLLFWKQLRIYNKNQTLTYLEKNILHPGLGTNIMFISKDFQIHKTNKHLWSGFHFREFYLNSIWSNVYT